MVSSFKLSLKTGRKEAAPGHLGIRFDYGAGKQLAIRPPSWLWSQRKGEASSMPHVPLEEIVVNLQVPRLRKL